MNKTKLELTWIGKDKRPKLEPRILLEDPSKSYHASHKVSENDIFDNKLIFGDNLLALKALEHEYTGKIKCIFIDPPYNTGNAFEHYDDGIEHSLWLSLMRDRLFILKKLLSIDGTIWISIDNNEAHYLKVLCDEVFMRKNFVTDISWHKRVSPANDAKYFSADYDHILVYAKNKENFKPNRIKNTQSQLKNFKNPDNDPRGLWNSSAYTCAKNSQERPNLYYPITNPNNNEVIWPKKTRVWAYGEKTHLKNEKENLVYWGKEGNGGMPRIKKFLKDSKGVVPRSIWGYEETGHNQQSNLEMLELFPDNPFSTPKPEKLIRRILDIATEEGDFVLDSFAGSGTTGAVAHKVHRKWIMVELEETIHSHIIPRLTGIVNGSDVIGISESIKWKGGGGFRFYNLAPSLLEKDQWDNWVINKDYNAEMLAEAICKLESFSYMPSDAEWWNHGYSTETDFIYVTTQNLSVEKLEQLSEEVGSDKTLLVCCGAFRCKPDRFSNLTIKKIPKMILNRCEWAHDDYSLNVANLPMAEKKPEQSDSF